MATALEFPALRQAALRPRADTSDRRYSAVILSFDVEEHFRIEAAAALALDPGLKEHYCRRLEPSTRWLLDQLVH